MSENTMIRKLKMGFAILTAILWAYAWMMAHRPGFGIGSAILFLMTYYYLDAEAVGYANSRRST